MYQEEINLFLKQIKELKLIKQNLRNQGKSNEQIKQVISLYLVETKNKINPNGDFDVI